MQLSLPSGPQMERRGPAATPLPTPSSPVSWALVDQQVVRAPSLDEVRTLIATADRFDPSFGAVLRLVAATGMRRGEVCALRWDDVDLSDETVRIGRSVVAAKGGAILRAPKTRASIRTVAIDPDTAAILEATATLSQRSLATACGLTFGSEAFLFSSEPGGLAPPHPDAMSHTFAIIRGQGEGRSRCAHAFVATLPRHRARPGHLRGTEAGPPRLVHCENGPPLHRLGA